MLAFGFFISCSTLQSSNPQSASNKTLTEKELKQEVSSLESRISEAPDQPDLHFEKGKLLTELAKKQKLPTNRVTPYTNARQALEKALQLYNDSTEAADQVKDLLNVTWSLEHNEGVKFFQGESDQKPDYERASAHFNNATIIIPDSANSYTMRARALYKNQQSQKAIGVLEKAQKQIDSPPAELLEQLAFLYLENDDPHKAVAVYEEAESFSDQNLNLLHGLSNAYINAGKHQQAIVLLNQLIENEPQNIIYAQTLGTELFFVGKSQLDSIFTALENGTPLEETQFDSAVTTVEKAREQFELLAEENPENTDVQKRTANFYYNIASRYQNLIPLVADEHQEQLEEKMTNYLSASIPFFERLATQNQQDQKLWDQLYKIYSILGMDEEAQNAKANL
ncbi:tetratricopeptide repeat protein [Fodinibius sp. Rm-B-1B1-1]|uniref:tetratricopeptide repeat protein n=1 Tax=Fodinibius alkaliphilus TaxID=3140241 RepID=UPI003159F26D